MTTTLTTIDECKNCTARGDMSKCAATPCSQHESWYAKEQASVIAAQSNITELLARLEAAEADAARYRFVKKSSMFCVAQWSDEDVDWFAIGEKQLDAPQVMEVNND